MKVNEDFEVLKTNRLFSFTWGKVDSRTVGGIDS